MLSLIFFLPQCLTAQNQNDKSLNEIIVSENRSQTLGQPNRSIQTISAEDIQNSGSRTLTEVLENTAGINVQMDEGGFCHKSWKITYIKKSRSMLRDFFMLH
ncbi:MAG: TonB-dependent receptor plug domain-containing protein [Bacteroidia bacterium]